MEQENTHNRMMVTFDDKLFSMLTEQAKESPRLRMNYDLRASADEESQRMLNAIEPGSVIPIHRHQRTNEVFVILRGKARQILYADNGEEKESFILCPNSEMCGMSIPAGVWHTIESLESGTIVMECKAGKYEPLSPDDMLP